MTTPTSYRGRTDTVTDWGSVPAYPWRDPALQAAYPPASLTIGERVAWAFMAYGKTDGFSGVHRVADLEAEPNEHDGHTFCGLPIPVSARRLATVHRSLDTCMTCEIAAASARASMRVSA